MRTTLDIDSDVLAAGKAIAAQRRQSLGKVISSLARQALQPPAKRSVRNGLPLLAVEDDTPVTTPDLINELRDEDSG